MNFSNETVIVLKNFAQINPSIVFKPGKKLTTISPQKSIMATAEITDDFPSEGAVYDLGRFLGVVSMFESPAYTFNETHLDIRDNQKSVAYTFCSPEMIVKPSRETIDLPSIDVDINITNEQFQAVMRAATIMQLPEICIAGRDDITLEAIDKENPTSDKYTQVLGANTTDNVFNFTFKTENLKMLPGNYNVQITKKGISKFTSINDSGPKLTYWITVEHNLSEYN
jgi:hypothetical protein